MPEQILTEARLEKPLCINGEAVSDTSRDILKLAVFERHHATGNVGLGFVQGLKLKRGAVASTVAMPICLRLPQRCAKKAAVLL